MSKIRGENREIKQQPSPLGAAYKSDPAKMGWEAHKREIGARHKKGIEVEASQPSDHKLKWRITTKRNHSSPAYLLQLFQGRCIDASFLKINNTGVDNLLNDALVNFTLIFAPLPEPRVTHLSARARNGSEEAYTRV